MRKRGKRARDQRPLFGQEPPKNDGILPPPRFYVLRMSTGHRSETSILGGLSHRRASYFGVLAGISPVACAFRRHVRDWAERPCANKFPQTTTAAVVALWRWEHEQDC